VRIALAWLVGTVVFALGMVLADRWFWAQCNGLPISRYAEVWICSNMPGVRIAVAAVAGLAAGLLAKRRGLAIGVLAALAGLAIVTLAYRPPVAYMPLSVLIAGVASFMIPTAVACVLGARVAGGAWRSSL
jgi:hypothetical protein